MRITEKRALLWKEWLLAIYCNHEMYYDCTLYEGIPDGDDSQTVYNDIACGEYDDAITDSDWDILGVYAYAKEQYGKHGWYIREKLIKTESEAIAKLTEMGYTFPNKIYKASY